MNGESDSDHLKVPRVPGFGSPAGAELTLGAQQCLLSSQTRSKHIRAVLGWGVGTGS